jgi:hypothetical protein
MSNYLANSLMCLFLFIMTAIFWKRGHPKLCTFFLVLVILYLVTLITELSIKSDHPDAESIINFISLLVVIFLVFYTKLWRKMPGYQYCCDCTKEDYDKGIVEKKAAADAEAATRATRAANASNASAVASSRH